MHPGVAQHVAQMPPAGSTDRGSHIGVCTATPSVPLIGPEQCPSE
jgi:hypothetical protein